MKSTKPFCLAGYRKKCIQTNEEWRYYANNDPKHTAKDFIEKVEDRSSEPSDLNPVDSRAFDLLKRRLKRETAGNKK